jgi:hypothetical protein
MVFHFAATISCQPTRILLWVFSPAYGDDGTRTHDLRLAKAALSQLSYIPDRDAPSSPGTVGHSGLEPETSPLSEARSNQLS